MSLRNDILQARDTAMKARDIATLSTLRVLFSQIKNEEIEKRHEISDEEVVAVVKKQVKQLKDSILDFEKGGRGDLVADAKKELDVLTQYLPEELSDEEIRGIIKETVLALDNNAQFGQVMGAVMKDVQGRADGARVRLLLQEHLK